MRSPRASGRRLRSMPPQARPAGTQERVGGCQAPAQMTPSRTPSTPSHARSQACRTGGHSSGARKTASCKTTCKGAYCVRLRRFEGACAGAARAAEGEEDPHSITGAKNSTITCRRRMGSVRCGRHVLDHKNLCCKVTFPSRRPFLEQVHFPQTAPQKSVPDGLGL